MKKICGLMLLALAVLLMVPADGAGGEAMREAVARVAAKSLPTMLRLIPAQEEKNYGFENVLEFSQTHTGPPQEIFTVEPDQMSSYSGGSFGALLHTTGVWYVPVLVGTDFRALLTVAREEGEWEVVGISAAGLARELQAFERQLSAWLNALGAQAKESPKFVRIFQAYADFMYLPTEGDEYLFPFSSARAALELTPDKLMTPGEVLPLLKLELGDTGW